MSTVWHKLNHSLPDRLSLIDITKINEYQFAVLAIEEFVNILVIHLYNTRAKRWRRLAVISHHNPWTTYRSEMSMTYLNQLYVCCGTEIIKIDIVTRKQNSVMDITHWWKRFKYSRVFTFDHKVHLVSIAWGETSEIHIYTLEEDLFETRLKKKLQINVGTIINNIHIQSDKEAIWMIGSRTIGFRTLLFEPLFLCNVVRDGNSLVTNKQTTSIIVKPNIGIKWIFQTLLMDISTIDAYALKLVILGVIETTNNAVNYSVCSNY